MLITFRTHEGNQTIHYKNILAIMEYTNTDSLGARGDILYSIGEDKTFCLPIVSDPSAVVEAWNTCLNQERRHQIQRPTF